MKWRDSQPRAYYANYEKVQTQNGRGWFEVYRLPGNVFAISEPQHMQEVNSFLIVGEERALLLDTGMGICEMEPLVRELYDGEIVAVNSHCHYDHIGGNHSFEPVYICDDERAKRIARAGAPAEALGNQLEEDMFLFDYPAGFEPSAFSIRPFAVRFMEEEDRFDLGGRALRVVRTPGHSEDSIMLYDEKNRILFTGDSFYLGALYAHFDSDELGHSDVKVYAESLERALCLAPETKMLYCSHNDFAVEPARLREAAAALRAIAGAQEEGSGNGALSPVIEGGLATYRFDGFSIICRAR